jgi:hypothetical protein
MSLVGNAHKSKFVREASKAAATPLFALLAGVLRARSTAVIIRPGSARNGLFLPCAAPFRAVLDDEAVTVPVR